MSRISAVGTAYSMTGFARVTGSAGERLNFTLTLKCVNHRFLDLHLRLPGNCDALEMQLRKLLKEKLHRGHVEVTLQLERETKSELQLNRPLVAAYVKAAREAMAENGLTGEPDVNAILRMPGAMTAENSAGSGSAAEDMQPVERAVLAQIDDAIDKLNTMRAQEGAALVAEMTAGMQRIAVAADEVAALRGDVRQAYFARMQQRIGELLQASESAEIAQQRILEEAALLAERSDVEEEIVRLRTHVQHFIDLLAAGGELGKKLDFLLQELNREANTLLSKTSGAIAGNGLRITELGLGMKSEIEKVREQVQNIE
ncbi:MAG TPA: YicC/YloC family endoribonuclease [Acidobacteriaceae bacterium]|nr:YicC/YloC family endoribonuclease [Acidobacteriaceae bacterium]